MDHGFYFEEIEGLFNKSANEKVSSNLGDTSQIGRLKLIGRGRLGRHYNQRRRHGRDTEEIIGILKWSLWDTIA